MKRYKIRCMGCLLAVFLMAAAVLAGCGDNTDTDGDKEIRTLEDGVLKVGINLDSRPMGYLDEETAKPVGFEVDMASAIAEKLGLKLEIIDTTKENLLNSLDADIYDCAISMIGVTKWNKERYAATNPYVDISKVKDAISQEIKSSKLAVFGKKKNSLIAVIEKQALVPLKKDGVLSDLSKKYFETDIVLKK